MIETAEARIQLARDAARPKNHVALRNDGVYVDGVKVPGVVLKDVDVQIGNNNVSYIGLRIVFDTITDERK